MRGFGYFNLGRLLDVCNYTYGNPSPKRYKKKYKFHNIGFVLDMVTICRLMTHSLMFNRKAWKESKHLISYIPRGFGNFATLCITLNIKYCGVSIPSSSHTPTITLSNFLFNNLVSICRYSSSPHDPVYVSRVVP